MKNLEIPGKTGRVGKNNKINEKIVKRPWQVFRGRFGALTRKPGDLMKNLEIPGKTGRVGRYDS